MKKKVITLLLSLVLASGSIGNVQVLAADITEQEAQPVQEEETTEQEEEPVQEEELAEEADTEKASEEVSKSEEEAEPVQENEEQVQEEQDSETGEAVDEEFDTSEEAAAEIQETEDVEMTGESEDALADIVDSGTCGENATWTLTGTENNLTLTISGSGKMESFSESSIPWASKRAKIKKVVVEDGITNVGSYAFYSLNKLTDVSLPSSITYIGYRGFENCVALKSITIPDSVTSIDEDVFSGCSSLTSITIPDGVTDIDEGTFRNCSSLASITIPDSVAYIWYDAFYDCDQLSKIYISDLGAWCGIRFYDYVPGELYLDGNLLTEVTIPDEITKIGSFPLRGRDSIKSVTIHESVKSIESDAFDGCGQLNKIYINDLGAWCSIRFDDYVPGNLYLDGKLLTEVTIPDEITKIGSYPLRGRDSIESITIPDSVTSIGENAFSDCSSLKSITIPDSVTSIYEGTFRNCSSLESITIPDSIMRVGGKSYSDEYYNNNDVFEGCNKLNKIYISDLGAWCGIRFYEHVPGNLYLDGKLLTEVTIPDEITEIDNYLFSGRDSIKRITIPDSVTSIGENAFSGCSGLTNITIPDSVTSIGEDAFSGCSSLTNITIPGSVETIGVLFSFCENLKSVTILDGVTSIVPYAFYYCDSLTSITIPDSVTSIGYWAFHGCSSLTSVTISNSVTSIGYHTFSGCSSLKSIIIPGSVTSIGECAFKNCSNLESITIPSSVTHIGGMGDPDYYEGYDDDTFEGCDKLNKIYISDLDAWCRIVFIDYVPGDLYLDGKLLTDVTIPDGITKIDSYAFSGRDSIKNVTISGSVETIAGFSGCENLKSVTILNGVTSIGSSAFEDCSNLESITIPESITCIGEDDEWSSYYEPFAGCDKLNKIYINDIGAWCRIHFYGHVPGDLYLNGKLLTEVTIPDGITEINSHAFSGRDPIKSITIPDSVTSIDYSAFSGCNSLTSITIPGSVSTIYGWVSGCKNLKSVTILNGVTSIGEYAFYNCSSLTNVTIPDSVTSIGDYAFWGCDGLKSITIPNGVTNIEDDAFPRLSWDTNDFVIFTQSQYVKDFCKEHEYAYFDKTAPSIAKLTSYNGSDIRVYFENRDEAIDEYSVFGNECVLGYQIKYADNKSMTGAKSIMLKDKKAASKVITGLKNGKTYYVQIQHYLKSGKVSYWSKWSLVKSVTVGQTPYNTNVSKLSTYIGSHIKVDWTKTAGASGYHIKYADNPNMTGAKEVMVKGNSTFTKTLTGLKNGKTYYVKIQTYRTVSGKTYWSSWSPAKSIKVDQIPYGSSIKNLTRVSATQMKITWDKAPSASGYHIQYRWYDGNSDKYVTKDIIINGNGTVSKTITGLKKYLDYEVRIQTFRKISGKTYWSSWSKYKYGYVW